MGVVREMFGRGLPGMAGMRRATNRFIDERIVLHQFLGSKIPGRHYFRTPSTTPLTYEPGMKESTDTATTVTKDSGHLSVKRRWITVVVCACVQVLTIGAILSLTVFLEEMHQSLDISYSTISLITSLSAALCQGAAPLATFILEFTGYRFGVILSGLFVCAALCGASFAPSATVAIILMGPTYGFSTSVALAASTIVPGQVIEAEKRHIAFSIVFTGAGIGMMVFPPIYQALINAFTWRGAVLILAAISLNLCVCGMLFPDRPDAALDGSGEESGARDPKTIPMETLETSPKRPSLIARFNLQLWCQPRFLALWFATFFLQFCGVGVGAFFFSICIKNYGVSKQEASFILTLLGISTIFGRLFVLLLRKTTLVPRWWIWSLVCGIMGVLMGLLGQFHLYEVGVFLYVTVGFIIGIIFPLHSVILTDLFPVSLLPSTYGFTYFALGIGALAGPPLAGRLRDLTGNYRMSTAVLGYLLAAVHAGVILALPCIIMKKRRESMGVERLQAHYEDTEKLDAQADTEALPLDDVIVIRRRAEWK